ncbi:MAG: hypothetical protein Q9217_004273, partial [Psora testacea]
MPTPFLLPMALALRYITAIPVEPLALEYLGIERRDTSFIEERDSGFAAMSCNKVKTYNATRQVGPFPAAARLAGAQQCVANAAGVAAVGFNAQVIVSVSTAESITTTVNCPPNCTCGLQVIPTMYHVEGYQFVTEEPSGGGNKAACYKKPDIQPYSVDFPVIDPKAAKNNQAVVQYSACVPIGYACPSDP